jgi:hypothetical protein
VRRGRVIRSVSPTHSEPIPLHCHPFELDATRRRACRGHVHDADPQVTAVFRRRTRDNSTSGAWDLHAYSVGIAGLCEGCRLRSRP